MVTDTQAYCTGFSKKIHINIKRKRLLYIKDHIINQGNKRKFSYLFSKLMETDMYKFYEGVRNFSVNLMNDPYTVYNTKNF